MPRVHFSSLVLIALAVPVIGCVSASGPRQLPTRSGLAAVDANDWSRVLALPPAAPVHVTVFGASSAARWTIRASDVSLTVLNLSDDTVPDSARPVLLQMVKEQTDAFMTISRGSSLQRQNVRIGRDGLFVDNRVVSRFERLVEILERDMIAEIQGPVVARGSVGGAMIGGWLGFSVGVVPGLGGAPAGAAAPALVASTVVGGLLGSRWSSHMTQGLIYRARP